MDNYSYLKKDDNKYWVFKDSIGFSKLSESDKDKNCIAICHSLANAMSVALAINCYVYYLYKDE